MKNQEYVKLYAARDIGQFCCNGDNYYNQFKSSLNRQALDGHMLIDYDALKKAINQYELALERATEIEWLDEISRIKGELLTVEQYKNEYPEPFWEGYNLEIGDLSCNICSKEHDGNCEEVLK